MKPIFTAVDKRRQRVPVSMLRALIGLEEKRFVGTPDGATVSITRFAGTAANRFVRREWSDGIHHLGAAAQAIGSAAAAAADTAGKGNPKEVIKAADALVDALDKLAMSLPEARSTLALAGLLVEFNPIQLVKPKKHPGPVLVKRKAHPGPVLVKRKAHPGAVPANPAAKAHMRKLERILKMKKQGARSESVAAVSAVMARGRKRRKDQWAKAGEEAGRSGGVLTKIKRLFTGSDKKVKLRQRG